MCAALREVGRDTTDAFPKPLTDALVQAADVVVTMGCGDACPVYPGKRYLDWNISDPLGRPSTRSARPARQSRCGWRAWLMNSPGWTERQACDRSDAAISVTACLAARPAPMIVADAGTVQSP